ncbi:MAG: hypothetical protein Q8P93_02580 [bacterium]|nr:hypothetical protein [bacterium]
MEQKPVFQEKEEEKISQTDGEDVDDTVAAEQRFKQDLEEGRYLGVLETYVSDEKWSIERVARDTWQNFFDAAGGSLDGVEMETAEEGGRIMVTITHDAEYDFRRLLHFGGGSKMENDTTAGKHGEGTRIYALHMLRDYGFQQVLFKSGDWSLEFYLDTVPAHEVPAEMGDARGLFVKLTELDEPYEGNAVELVTANKENIEPMREARDFFYHSENVDFMNPDIDNKKGGFKIHPGENGNLYINGQRINYNSRDEWQTMPGMSVWTWSTPRANERRLQLGRERSMVYSREFIEIIAPFLTDELSREDSEILLEVFEPLYPVDAKISEEEECIFDAVVEHLAKEGVTRMFPDNYLAGDIEDAELLKNLGYVICQESLEKVGMKLASNEIELLGKLHSVEMGEQEKERAELVESFMAGFIAEANLDSRILARPMQSFMGDHPALHGKYEDGAVFIHQSVLRSNNLAKLLATYKHEICHAVGPDNSEIFSYALTDMDEAWTRFMLENPDGLKKLHETFLEFDIYPFWTSYEEFEIATSPLIKRVIRGHLEGEHVRYRDEGVEKTQSAMRRIIDNQFGGEFTAANVIEIYRTVQEHKSFKTLVANERAEKMPEEEQKAYIQEKEELDKELKEVKRKMAELKDPIVSRKKRQKISSDLKRAIERALGKTNYTELERERDMLNARIQKVKEHIFNEDTYLSLIASEGRRPKIMEEEVDIVHFRDTSPIAHQAMIELAIENITDGQDQDEALRTLGELLIFSRRSLEDPKKQLEMLAFTFSRIQPLLREEPSKNRLAAAQMLFEWTQSLPMNP